MNNNDEIEKILSEIENSSAEKLSAARKIKKKIQKIKSFLQLLRLLRQLRLYAAFISVFFIIRKRTSRPRFPLKQKRLQKLRLLF